MPTVHNREAIELPPNAVVRAVRVPDPFEAGATITVIRSDRDDVLARLHAWGCVDDAQLVAGRILQGHYECGAIGGIKSMDPAKVYVDGGQMAEPLTESVQRAMAEIRRLEGKLGSKGAGLARDVLMRGYNLRECAEIRGCYTAGQREAIKYRFREVMETVVEELGLVTKK